MLLPKYDFCFPWKGTRGEHTSPFDLQIQCQIVPCAKFSVKLYRVQEIIYASDPKNIISSVSFTLTNATAQTG